MNKLGQQECLELAKKCGLHVPMNTPHCEYDAKLLAFASAIEEKHQEQIAEIRTAWHINMLRLFPEKSHEEIAKAIEAVSGKSALDAFIAEVKAEERHAVLEELQEFFSDAVQADFENGVKSLNEREAAEFKRRFPNIWEGIGKVGTMLEEAELRTQAQAEGNSHG